MLMLGELLIVVASALDFLTTLIATQYYSCNVEINLIPRVLCDLNLLIFLVALESIMFLALYEITRHYSRVASYIIIIISYYPAIHNTLFLFYRKTFNLTG